MTKAAAWIMNIDEDLYVSISQMELVHILNDPPCVQIPQAPPHCNRTLLWNDALLPIIDLSLLLEHKTPDRAGDVVAVAIYQDAKGEHRYGGIRQLGSPKLEYVTNDQVCALPGHFDRLTPATLSCFSSTSGHSVPILDVSRLFSREYAETIVSQQHTV